MEGRKEGYKTERGAEKEAELQYSDLQNIWNPRKICGSSVVAIV